MRCPECGEQGGSSEYGTLPGFIITEKTECKNKHVFGCAYPAESYVEWHQVDNIQYRMRMMKENARLTVNRIFNTPTYQ